MMKYLYWKVSQSLPSESAFVRTLENHPEVSEGQPFLTQGVDEVLGLEMFLIGVSIAPDLHDVNGVHIAGELQPRGLPDLFNV